MFWYSKNLGVCGYYDYESLSSVKNPEMEFIIVYDLVDGFQENWGHFMSKVKHVEKALKEGKRVIAVRRGGMSRSNAVVLAVLLRQGRGWYEANEIIYKNPESRIEMKLAVKGEKE